MSLLADLPPESRNVVLRDIYEEALRLFGLGDLKLALRYLKTYISAGGTKQNDALDYITRIGERALRAGEAYQNAKLWRHAKEHFALAMETGSDTPAKKAKELLLTVPLVELPAFKGPAPKAAPVVRGWRRPHMEFSKLGPLRPGDAFEVKVFANQSDPKPGEESTTIKLPAGPKVYVLEVTLLATAHFRVDEPQVQPFRIERAKIDTETKTFKVSVVNAGRLAKLADQPASLCATFRYEGRPAGKVLRQFDFIGGVVSRGVVARKDPNPPGPPDSVAFEPNASPADLTVTIAAQQDENDNRHFWCTVQTSLLAEYCKGVTEPWVTAETTDKIVARYMQAFAAEGINRVQRLARLRGAGINLFDAAPGVFRKAFWKLINDSAKLKTIAITSAESFIPWELMIPHRDARGKLPAEYRDPLGVEFRVGRMTRRSLISGVQKLALDRCYVVAPVFEGPNSLPHAQNEADFILKKIAGDPIKPATLHNIDARLRGCRSLVHFACHGGITDDREQLLYLGEDEAMSALELRGLKGPAQGVPKARPLIFLNACKAGQPVPALVGVGGLAAVFAELGAGAVVAPLWSVKDTIAHEVAREFYTTVKAKKSVPFAEIVQKIRAKAYDEAVGEDSYAAYCFYGDPLATPV